MYSPLIWQHLQNTQNRGPLPGADGVGESRFPPCGDHLILQLQLEDGRIQEARFLAKACAPVIAVASLATTQMVGLTPDQARQLSVIRLDQDMGGLPPAKRHALWMFLEALANALDQATPPSLSTEMEHFERKPKPCHFKLSDDSSNPQP